MEIFQAAWPEQRFCGGARCRAQLEAWVEAKGGGAAARRVEEELRRASVSYGERTCRRAALGCEGSFEARSPNQLYCAPCQAVVAREQGCERQRRLRESRRLHEERRKAAEAARADVGERRAWAGCHASHESCQSALCDRPGCYETRRAGATACYCGPACAAAMRRVLDRERKWWSRGTPVGRLKRRLVEGQARAEEGFGRPVSAPP